MSFVADLQRGLCTKHNAHFEPPAPASKLGIALNMKTGSDPANGLRHPPSGETNGWYLWAGEQLEERNDFFVPLHVENLDAWRPGLLRFLALPPGWRFLVAGAYEDVWFDPSLLNV